MSQFTGNLFPFVTLLRHIFTFWNLHCFHNLQKVFLKIPKYNFNIFQSVVGILQFCPFLYLPFHMISLKWPVGSCQMIHGLVFLKSLQKSAWSFWMLQWLVGQCIESAIQSRNRKWCISICQSSALAGSGRTQFWWFLQENHAKHSSHHKIELCFL